MEKGLWEQEKDLLYLFWMKIWLLKDSRVLIDGVTETVKNELKKQEGWFLGALL